MPGPKNRRLDIGRLSSLLARPGMDTRVWLTYAVVRDVSFDPEHGIFADVTFLPSEIQETVLVSSGYAGNGFGAWAPLAVDDMVLVAVPGGDSNDGGVIISRLWTGLERPPALAQGAMGAHNMSDPSNDLSVRVEDGKKLLVQTHAGAIEITAEAAGIRIATTGAFTVSLTAPDATVNFQAANQPFVRGDAYADALGDFLDALDTFTDGIAHAAPAAPNAALTVPVVLALQTPLHTAIVALKEARTAYLSTKVKGE